MSNEIMQHVSFDPFPLSFFTSFCQGSAVARKYAAGNIAHDVNLTLKINFLSEHSPILHTSAIEPLRFRPADFHRKLLAYSVEPIKAMLVCLALVYSTNRGRVFCLLFRLGWAVNSRNLTEFSIPSGRSRSVEPRPYTSGTLLLGAYTWRWL